jgi:AcrR family transcriptional regulator
MAQSDTVERILSAASALFAERGYSETSLRTITSTAGVNLAAVNYHFGSKKELIQAVFGRFLAPFCKLLDEELDKLLAKYNDGETSASVDELLEVLFRTLLTSTAAMGERPSQFMKLLGLAYTQSQDHLRHYIIGEFGQYYSRFTGLLEQANPNISPVTFYWRLYFILGASVFTLSSYDPISNILKTDYGQESTIENTVSLLVPSLSAMLQCEDLN